jgi:hypothetical protein
MPIGLQHLADKAAADADNAIVAVQRNVHAVNVDNLRPHVPAQNKAVAHFVKL